VLISRGWFAMSLLVGGCVLPPHRGVATVSNGWLFGGGVVLGAMASSDASNPNSWRDLDHAVGQVAAGVIILAVLGEALTLTFHHDDPPPVTPASGWRTSQRTSAADRLASPTQLPR
jgi:hypothetical protein